MASLTRDIPTMCGVCGRVAAFAEQRGWQHDAQDESADHLMVPVRIEDAPDQLQARCDFCNVTGTIDWELPARDFPYPVQNAVGPVYMSEGAWAACDYCADLLRRHRWNELLDRAIAIRVVTGAIESKGEAIGIRHGLRLLYDTLRANALGGVEYKPMRP